jgi:hypothetical protein
MLYEQAELHIRVARLEAMAEELRQKRCAHAHRHWLSNRAAHALVSRTEHGPSKRPPK